MNLDRREIFRMIAWVGAAAVLGGLLRYLIQGELLTFAKWLLITGGALILFSIVAEFRALLAYFSLRSTRLGANTFTLGLGILAILVFLNFLGYKHHKRFDLTTEGLYTLSDETRQITGGLKQDVDVYYFAKKSAPEASELRDEMAEYMASTPHLRFQVVDPEERFDLAKQMGITHANQLIVSSNGRTERPDGITEQDITNAILKVTRDKTVAACFVEGHGEKSITSMEATGLKAVSDELERENYKTRAVNLVAEQKVPGDCDVLVDAGPVKAPFPAETQAVAKFLDNGGKVLLLIDPETDPQMDAILGEWNIELGKNIVIDASGVGRLLQMGPGAPVVVDYGANPITRNFQNSMTFFYLARTVSLADPNKTEPNAVELLKTSPRSFTAPGIPKNGEVRFEPGKDKTGPLSLGVAAAWKKGTGDSAKEARLVVIGDSDFATNQFETMQRNGDLFLNSIGWLAQEEDLISIRPKSPMSRQITLTEAQSSALYLAGTYLLPLVVICAGFAVWLKRR